MQRPPSANATLQKRNGTDVNQTSVWPRCVAVFWFLFSVLFSSVALFSRPVHLGIRDQRTCARKAGRSKIRGSQFKRERERERKKERERKNILLSHHFAFNWVPFVWNSLFCWIYILHLCAAEKQDENEGGGNWTTFFPGFTIRKVFVLFFPDLKVESSPQVPEPKELHKVTSSCRYYSVLNCHFITLFPNRVCSKYRRNDFLSCNVASSVMSWRINDWLWVRGKEFTASEASCELFSTAHS